MPYQRTPKLTCQHNLKFKKRKKKNKQTDKWKWANFGIKIPNSHLSKKEKTLIHECFKFWYIDVYSMWMALIMIYQSLLCARNIVAWEPNFAGCGYIII